MTSDEFIAEYARLGHAIQTGVAYAQERDPKLIEPKHLRTGLDLVMSNVGSLGRLFIAKGLITEDEYYAAILEGLRAEVRRYEQYVSDLYGARKITLV